MIEIKEKYMSMKKDWIYHKENEIRKKSRVFKQTLIKRRAE